MRSRARHLLWAGVGPVERNLHGGSRTLRRRQPPSTGKKLTKTGQGWSIRSEAMDYSSNVLVWPTGRPVSRELVVPPCRLVSGDRPRRAPQIRTRTGRILRPPRSSVPSAPAGRTFRVTDRERSSGPVEPLRAVATGPLTVLPEQPDQHHAQVLLRVLDAHLRVDAAVLGAQARRGQHAPVAPRAIRNSGALFAGPRARIP